MSRPDLEADFPYILITGARQPGLLPHREPPAARGRGSCTPTPSWRSTRRPPRRRASGTATGSSIESPRGKIRQRAKLTDGLHPRVVSAQHAWWFPEKRDPGHGWDESNVNILTDNGYDNCDPAMGATSIRTLLCSIRPEGPRDDSGDADWAAETWAGDRGRAAAGRRALASRAGAHAMTRYRLRIDDDLCWGCKTCEVACKAENGAPTGVKLIRVTRRALLEGRRAAVPLPREALPPLRHADVRRGLSGRRPSPSATTASWCSTKSRCDGCRACMEACPYDAIAFDDGPGRGHQVQPVPPSHRPGPAAGLRGQRLPGPLHPLWQGRVEGGFR